MIHFRYIVMTGSDFFTSADPLLSANNSLFVTSMVGPPSPPWDENDLDLDNFEVKDVEDFLSLSPESLRLDSETDEAITTFLTSVGDGVVSKVLDDLDDLSRSSSEVFYDLIPSPEEENNNNNNKPTEADSNHVGHCSVCTLVFASSQLLDKHRQEYSETVTCCHCGKNFSTLSKLRTHHRKHSKEKPFQCQVCGKYYTHRNTLARHQLLYCKQLRMKTSEEEEEEENHLTKMILEAEVILDGSTSADKPVAATAPAAVRKRKQTADLSNNSKQAKTTGDTTLKTKCIVCDKDFFDADSLANHSSYHLGNRECCKCHKVLGNKSKLLTHHRSHTKELPYHCSLCSKSFAELSTLRKHEATHGERNFRCDICAKAFVRKDYLAKHSLTHRQTFKCSQCAYVCHNKTDIEAHVGLHEAN